jgi:hypothetical protein
VGFFSTTPPAYQGPTALGTAAASQIYSGTGTSVGGTGYPFAAGVTLSNLTIQNSGVNPAFIGIGSTVTATTGLELPAGDTLVLEASQVKAATGPFNLWAISSGGATTVEASLGTVVAND